MSKSSLPPRRASARVEATPLEAATLAAIPVYVLVIILLVTTAITILTLAIWPGLPARLAQSFTGTTQTAYWYLSRSSAMVSYGLLWLSMVLGLIITNKLASLWPGGPTYVALHENSGLLALLLAALHALALLGDRYIGYNLIQILTPFASGAYHPLAVGVGQLAIYLLALVVVSYYLRRWIGQRAWRVLHSVNFALFLMVTLHGLFAGSDTRTFWALALYCVGLSTVTGLTVARVADALMRAGAFA